MKTICRLITLLALLLSAKFSAAETTQGYDVLGVATYCQTFLNAPQLPAASTLVNTFGNPFPCMEKRIQKGNFTTAQFDLIDATCWRNHNCPPGVPRPDDLKVIKARAQKVSVLAEKYPGVKFWVSPALEHDVKDTGTVIKMLKAAKEGCPKCEVINSPVSGATPAGYPVERHGTQVRSFSVSSDGKSAFDGDNIRSDGNGFEHRVSGTNQTYFWWNELNDRCSGEKNFTPVGQRTERPTDDQFRQAYITAQPEAPKPDAPPQCKTARDITMGKEIMKPNAESYCNGQKKDGRGNKPLLIITKQGQRRGDRINIVRADGKTVGAFCYYGPYTDPKLFRWYVGDCSDQFPAQLYDDLGSEWGFVELGGGNCLRFNAIRRQGTYR